MHITVKIAMCTHCTCDIYLPLIQILHVQKFIAIVWQQFKLRRYWKHGLVEVSHQHLGLEKEAEEEGDGEITHKCREW